MEIPVTHTAPKIEIDHEKCEVPFLCKKCLLICPQVVFTVRAIKVERLRETDPREPGSYQVNTGPRFKCTGCNECIDVCPVDAITITWP
ncbi:MAG: 4Fe-4S dicluster domain-containing protein [Dehalococcoidia bacterium]